MDKMKKVKIWPYQTGIWTPDLWTKHYFHPRFEFWGSSRFLKNLDFMAKFLKWQYFLFFLFWWQKCVLPSKNVVLIHTFIIDYLSFNYLRFLKMKFRDNSILPVHWLSPIELWAIPGLWDLSSIEQGQSVLALVDQQYWQVYPEVKPGIRVIQIVFRQGLTKCPLLHGNT